MPLTLWQFFCGIKTGIIKRCLTLIGRAAFEAVVDYKVTNTFVYVCVLLGNHFVAPTAVSEELHCLVEEYCFY